jgi:hypothetical protein
VGLKGSEYKIKSMRFPIWVHDGINVIAKENGLNFTDYVNEILRSVLFNKGITIDGRITIEQGEAQKRDITQTETA